jgi:hypothetical protein
VRASKALLTVNGGPSLIRQDKYRQALRARRIGGLSGFETQSAWMTSDVTLAALEVMRTISLADVRLLIKIRY